MLELRTNTPDIDHLLNPPEYNATVIPVTYVSNTDLPNRSVIRNVRQWLNDNRNWKAVISSLPEVGPQSTSSQARASVQNLPIPLSDVQQNMGGHVLICTTEGIEKQKAELWTQLYSIAKQHFMFVRTCYPLYGRC